MKINMVELNIKKEDKFEKKNHKTDNLTIKKDSCKLVNESNMCGN